MRVGCKPYSVRGPRLRGWVVLTVAAALIAGCSSDHDELERAANSHKQTTSKTAASSKKAHSAKKSDDVLAEFSAWAKDDEKAGSSDTSKSSQASGPDVAQASSEHTNNPELASNPSPVTGNGAAGGSLDDVIERFNQKVRTCWKQPFGMPRLATVRLLVQFNPDGTVRNVAPRPDPAEASRYRTEAPYMVMIAQTSQALRKCQPYEGIKENFAKLSQLEMTVDPRMFEK